MGRPSTYNERYPTVVTSIMQLGGTLEDAAKAFDIAVSTLFRWGEKYPAFSEALKESREKANATAVASLFKAMNGYEYDEIQTVIKETPTGTIKEIKKTRKTVPPNMTGLMFWLQNRAPDEWRNVQHHEGNINHTHKGMNGFGNMNMEQLENAKVEHIKRRELQFSDN